MARDPTDPSQDEPEPPGPNNDGSYSLKKLRLNIDAAKNGETWRLLPEGFQDDDCGRTYPLPSGLGNLRKLLEIEIPPYKRDSGVTYLRRAEKKYKELTTHRRRIMLSVGEKEHRAKRAMMVFQDGLHDFRRQARDAVNKVKEDAALASASLTDLFSLARRGLDGQMRAHLDNKKWNGESVSASDFRECARLVLQGVKGLGVPSPERERAREAIIEEAAAAMKETQDTVALGTSTETEQ